MRRPRLIRYGILAVVVIGLFLWAKGSKNRTYEGILKLGEEREAFYQNGDCSASPYWFEVQDRDLAHELMNRWGDLGRPRQLYVKFVGDKSWIGAWGHMGKYVREVRPHTLLEVSTAPRPWPP